MGKAIVQFCGACKRRKPIKGFDIQRGLCAQCAQNRADAPKKAPPKRKSSEPTKPKTWKCPICLQRVAVSQTGTDLKEHRNARHKPCAGSGHTLPLTGRDAMDYRSPGSFEGGRH